LQATTAINATVHQEKNSKKLITSLVEKINNQNDIFSPIVILTPALETILP
jgi:hypothetical protein